MVLGDILGVLQLVVFGLLGLGGLVGLFAVFVCRSECAGSAVQSEERAVVASSP